jgi:hypothetical protein
MIVLPLAQGSEANEQTKVTFDHSVEVPGVAYCRQVAIGSSRDIE